MVDPCSQYNILVSVFFVNCLRDYVMYFIFVTPPFSVSNIV